MANIIDVAKRAGVGIATVSRVINNSGYVKKETRDKVESVIKDMGYVPNEIARSMIMQKNHIVAFIVPTIKHIFFSSLLYYLEEELFKYGYKVMICNSAEQIDKEIEYLDMLKKNRVDAVVLVTNNDIEQYLDKTLKIISFDRHFAGVPYVSSDNYQGGVLAAKHLITKGCKNLLFVGDDAQGKDVDIYTEVNKRQHGFIDYAKKQSGINVDSIMYSLGDYINIPQSILERLEQYNDVDGIFTISDSVATEVIRFLRFHGKKVPEDIRVIGYDGGDSFCNLGDRLTSIHQDSEQIAIAISNTIKNYYNNKKPENKIIPVELNLGDTA